VSIEFPSPFGREFLPNCQKQRNFYCTRLPNLPSVTEIPVKFPEERELAEEHGSRGCVRSFPNPRSVSIYLSLHIPADQRCSPCSLSREKPQISLKNDAFYQARARCFPAFFQNIPAFPKLQGETPKISDFIDTEVIVARGPPYASSFPIQTPCSKLFSSLFQQKIPCSIA